MALSIETFDNQRGGNTLYKALTHPHTAAAARALVGALARSGPVAIYDPDRAVEGFAEIFALDGVEIAGIYVPEVVRIGTTVLGRAARPANEIDRSGARAVFVAAFDAERPLAQIEPHLPAGVARFTLDRMRLPADRLTNLRRYLDPLNFTTNFAFFRDAGGLSTRLVTANYWAGYGAAAVSCWLTLFAGNGAMLAEWCEPLAAPRDRTPRAAGGALVIDSREIRRRFGLGEFCGQLFLHVVGAAGHDVVKYALDVCGEGDVSLSATHDANAWPAERYAGLPAPAPGERVVLWVQNSHPAAIPAGAIRLDPMSATCCPISPGRGRSNSAPASTWCARATRSSRKSAGTSRMSMSSAATSPPIRPCPTCATCSARAIYCPRRSCRAANGRASYCRPR
jgi:hypothetical protein